MKLALLFVVLSCSFWVTKCANGDVANPLENVVFVVLSQPNEHHVDLATETRKNVRDQLVLESVTHSVVLLSHQDLPLHGGWTIFPLLSSLAHQYSSKYDWFVFLQESTKVNVTILKDLFRKYNPDEPTFIGHALKDREHSIIHHYEPPDALSYPDFASGFILSHRLVDKLSARIESHREKTGALPGDFSIDAQYEFAKMVLRQDLDGGGSVEVEEGPRLLHEPLLCTVQQESSCAIMARKNVSVCGATTQSVQLLAKDILFAVKTCEKFHKERLPIISDTWAPAAPNVMYFSEANDKDYDTVVLPGVKNTQRGHCQKTMAIVKYFDSMMANSKSWKWLVIADDDTLLSVHKVAEMLHCYSPDHTVVLGQRYGFRVALGTHGYDYVTGGGGMVFSRRAVKRLLEKTSHCSCHSPDSPDDMHLGACMSNLGVSLVHSPRFHQGRPEDYPEQLLAHQNPVSFHKFWNNDPRQVYDEWFRQSDEHLRLLKSNQVYPHQEL